MGTSKAVAEQTRALAASASLVPYAAASEKSPRSAFDTSRHDGVPIAKRPLDLRALLAFALVRRAAAPSVDDLDGPLSWERFFGTEE